MDKDAIEVAYEMAKADAEARAAFEKDPSVGVEFYFEPDDWYMDRPSRENPERLDPPGETLYRLKPEPTYRPYTREELPELVGKVVKRKEDGPRTRLSVSCFDGYVRLGTSYAAIYPSTLLKHYTYMDGTPCGVRE